MQAAKLLMVKFTIGGEGYEFAWSMKLELLNIYVSNANFYTGSKMGSSFFGNLYSLRNYLKFEIIE